MTQSVVPIYSLPVLIVGAGLTGLTLACDLARRGVAFRLIEKAPAYFPGSRGKTLQPRSLEVLDDLGVMEAMLQHGRFHQLIRSYEGTRIVDERDLFAGLYPTPAIPYAAGLWIPQFRVEEVLRDHLGTYGHRVELGTELLAVDQNDHEVTATIQHHGQQEHVHCQYLVGADGGRSFVRKALNFRFVGEQITGKMFAGDVHVEGLEHEHIHMWKNHPDGIVALCPFATSDVFQFQAQAPPGFEGEPSLALFQQILNERSGRTDLRLTNPTWLSVFGLSVRMVEHFRQGRVFLAGDAAHVHSPAGGQGMNTGMQDAYNLGWKLGAVLRGAKPDLLDTYEEERLPVAAAVLGLSTRMLQNIQRSGAQQLPGGTEMLQLGIQYRASSLSCHEGAALLLQAGDRAPDAPILDDQGNRIRLFDVFRGTHFTLLSFGNEVFDELTHLPFSSEELKAYTIHSHLPEEGAGRHALLDDHAHAADAYGATKDVIYLIRPDGYIGWSGRRAAIGSLEAYWQPFSATDTWGGLVETDNELR